jgi:SAM-dependent MidA family methyltransferase
MIDSTETEARLAGLRDDLHSRIVAGGGRITFRDYMDAALYAPGYGYYAVGAVALGRGGDFVTSPEVHPAFGQMIAHWLARVDAALGRPDPFQAVEMGAGSGRLAADLLAALYTDHPDLFARVRYHIIERSTGLRAQQELLLAGLPGASVTWSDDLAALPPGSVTGAIFSNELVDAFPVHRVAMTAGGLQELFVGLDEAGNLCEVAGPPSIPDLAAHLAWLGVAPPVGVRSEINLDAVRWMRAVAGVLDRGAVLTIDYGDSAERIYSDLRPDGTLLCYTQGRVGADPFVAPGAQDMTAHVDFTALQQAGAEGGLATTALTRQMHFLVDLGIGDLLAAVGPTYAAQAATLGVQAATAAMLDERARLFRLIDPDGLGRFHVLVQERGTKDEGRGTRDEV